MTLRKKVHVRIAYVHIFFVILRSLALELHVTRDFIARLRLRSVLRSPHCKQPTAWFTSGAYSKKQNDPTSNEKMTWRS